MAGATLLRLIDPHDLSATDRAGWEDLAESAGAGNPFVQPWLQERALAHFDRRHCARLAVVEDRCGTWLGTIAVIRARSGRVPVRVWSAWSHANQFNGTPLVREGRAAAFWEGLLTGLDRHGGGAPALALASLPLDDPVNRALIDLCAAQGRRLVRDRCWQRAVLEDGTEPAEMEPKLRRRIAGLERKLEREQGEPVLEVTRDPARISELAEAFVALEASGWKGRAGSALASSVETRGFFTEVAEMAARRGAFEVAALSSGGRIVAMSTQLVGGGVLHGFKSAYDEAFASHAPGLLLLERLTRVWSSRPGRGVDSCTRPGQEPIGRLWSARRELADFRVALGGPLRRGGFAALLAAEAGWHALKRVATGRRNADKA